MALIPEYRDDTASLFDDSCCVFDQTEIFATKKFLVVTVDQLPGIRVEHRFGETFVRRFVIITDRSLREALARPRETELEAIEKPADEEFLERSARALLEQLAGRLDGHSALWQPPQQRPTPIGQKIPVAPARPEVLGRYVFFGRRPGAEHCLELLTDQGELVRIAGTVNLKDALEASGAMIGDRVKVRKDSVPTGLSLVGSPNRSSGNGETYSVTTLEEEEIWFEPSPVDWPTHR